MSLLHRTKPLVVATLSVMGRLSKGITFGVRGLVLDGDRVLLVRHSYVPGWYLPGGAVEPRESAVDAIRRELLEEANLTVTGTPVLAGLFFNREMAARDHIALYHVTDWTLPALPKPNHEIVAVDFFPLAALPEGTTAATRRRLDEHLTGAAPSPTW
ncbi:NUDIX domain-containing protein [Oleomonas cavernae]|nr:NUDIX domain-containing protein [Oleomonas cavernae]